MYILLFAIKSYTWWIDLHQVKFMLDAFLIDVTASACSGGGVRGAHSFMNPVLH